jgi:hypothetical protein
VRKRGKAGVVVEGHGVKTRIYGLKNHDLESGLFRCLCNVWSAILRNSDYI